MIRDRQEPGAAPVGMKAPTVRTAEHLARAAGGDGAIVIAFDGGRFAGASWGATMPLCRDLGRRLDAIVDAMQRGELTGDAPTPAPPKRPTGTVPRPEPEADEEWEEFVGEATDLLSELDDMPEQASDFADSVGEKVQGMIEWAREHKHVTQAMQAALANMADGAARWRR